MELTNRFTVGVPVAEAWAVLTDVERIAPCLPGAQLQEIQGDEYRGIVKVKVGPITAQYKGRASFLRRDDAEHVAVLKAEGRDTRGQGNASATITATLTPEGSGTAVTVVTDLTITGKVAQFGRGVLVDVSGKLLTQFVECLENDLLAAPAAVMPAPAPADEPAIADAVSEQVASWTPSVAPEPVAAAVSVPAPVELEPEPQPAPAAAEIPPVPEPEPITPEPEPEPGPERVVEPVIASAAAAVDAGVAGSDEPVAVPAASPTSAPDDDRAGGSDEPLPAEDVEEPAWAAAPAAPAAAEAVIDTPAPAPAASSNGRGAGSGAPSSGPVTDGAEEAAASAGGTTTATEEPPIRRIEHEAAPAVDLLDAAGVPVAKRAVPLVSAVLLILWFLRRRRSRR